MDTVLAGSSSLLRPSIAPVSLLFRPSNSHCTDFISLRNKLRFGYSCQRKHQLLRSRNVDKVPKFVLWCGAIREINKNEFQSTVLESERPVLVEFVANWCGPCRLIAPAMESIAQEYGDRLTVIKIDHDANPQLIEEYKVYGLPTLILFKDGQEVPESRREGAITKVKLEEYLDTLLETISIS
ncbi:hypothetical protein SLA2020_056990 [Shorea laevis]